ncbi:aspartate/tyrosine/aromatic aminotransferase [Erythrobacteraceae bacterium CFH 75059]|uniref:amino acid aminotransferase n=1 Tax=Qipengyuania thermophila TaxID=2509361 RepID=UPI0010211A49|nr:aromatic amino acid transaminase [Qipengyuania thermophila]TCD04076.1 aspartate/tyrosine/aromatic aminotransferase [Erythrobacteraceae bacterium CFH 75059]
MLDRLTAQPADPLLALIRLHAADERPGKIDLGVGVYRDESGATPVFRAVKEAEERLLRRQDSKSYLGPEGSREFVTALRPWVFDAAGETAHCVSGMQTPGGTGAVRLALALVKKAGGRRVLLGTPSWPNHRQIIDDLGLDAVEFVHVHDGGADADGLMALLEDCTARDAVILHGCCHNPTGIDYDAAQWSAIADALARTGVLPIVDVAYQGLGRGMHEDLAGLRAVLDRVDAALVAYSCDKNFGLYRDRVGALFVAAKDQDVVERACSNANALARANWSMPPDHGAAAAAIVLEDAGLVRMWQDELDSMRDRIARMRTALASGESRVPGIGLEAVGQGNGLFAMLLLDATQVERLRTEHAVYMAGSGRINVAGLTDAKVDAFLSALEQVCR